MYTIYIMFDLDFRNTLVLLSLVVHGSLLWILYRYGRTNPAGKAYSVAILAIAGWVFPMALYRADLFGMVELWARILYIMASFTSTSFFVFTVIFPHKTKISVPLQILIFIENVSIILLCLHPTLFITGVTKIQDGEDIIHWGPLYFVYALHISMFFLFGLMNLFFNMLHEIGIVKKQLKTIFIGYFIGSNLAMTTNLILPWFGYFELNWLGQLFSTAVAIFTTYAILKHNLLRIRLIATEGFVIILNVVLFIQLITSQGSSVFLINGFIFILVLIVSYLLIQSVKKEIERKDEVLKLANSLKRANSRLMELDRQKTEFLSIASHQLRTPLSVVKGYIELIEDGAYGRVSKDLKKVLSDMDLNNERLVNLVDDFLDITRIEQGRVRYNFAYADIHELLADILHDLEEKAKLKKIKIQWKKNDNLKRVFMDDTKIRHVIVNYLDNAIKYSEKGVIKVVTQKRNGGLSLAVVDQGIGFGKEDQVNFFQKFYRGKNVDGYHIDGTGLGIYVCKKFIQMHNGHVWAKSDGPGKGSEFGFWIPLQETPEMKKTLQSTDKKEKKRNKQDIVNQYEPGTK